MQDPASLGRAIVGVLDLLSDVDPERDGLWVEAHYPKAAGQLCRYS